MASKALLATLKCSQINILLAINVHKNYKYPLYILLKKFYKTINYYYKAPYS